MSSHQSDKDYAVNITEGISIIRTGTTPSINLSDIGVKLDITTLSSALTEGELKCIAILTDRTLWSPITIKYDSKIDTILINEANSRLSIPNASRVVASIEKTVEENYPDTWAIMKTLVQNRKGNPSDKISAKCDSSYESLYQIPPSSIQELTTVEDLIELLKRFNIKVQ